MTRTEKLDSEDRLNASPSKRQHPRQTGEDRLPGDLPPEDLVERMIRVDHAGEFGAVRDVSGESAERGQDIVAKLVFAKPLGPAVETGSPTVSSAS